MFFLTVEAGYGMACGRALANCSKWFDVEMTVQESMAYETFTISYEKI